VADGNGKPGIMGRVLLVTWHVLVALCFVVAYLTSDPRTFGRTHMIIGEVLLGLLGLRLIAGLFCPTGSALALPWTRAARHRSWVALRPGRGRALAWMTAAVVLLATAATISGLGDPGAGLARLLHDRLSDLAVATMAVHGAIALFQFAS
jgi:hypothetical protein